MSHTVDEGGSAAIQRLSFAELCHMNAGLFGIQIVWGLQNVNTSRIFQTLGADMAQLPLLWIAAPITGLLVQPIVGHWSDRLTGSWGRRKPFIAVGTALTAIGMLAMANAASLGMAIAALWLLTGAVNVAMQPFRSLAADRMPAEQRTRGFTLQVFFIGAGAVVASVLPWTLTNLFGVRGTAPPGTVPDSLAFAFRIGAAVLVGSVGWTLLHVREGSSTAEGPRRPAFDADRTPAMRLRGAVIWFGAGALCLALGRLLELDRESYFLGALMIGYGGLRLLSHRRRRNGAPPAGVLQIVHDIAAMPLAMRRLAATQFFSWFALFTMWVYAVPAVAARQFATLDAGSRAYAAAGDWVGVLFATYDAVAAGAALAMPLLMGRLGLRRAHAACLSVGAGGLAFFPYVDSPAALLLPALAIGVAWASILSVPYVVVAEAAPVAKRGVYMGIHNIFLVLPQLVGAITLGMVSHRLLAGRPEGTMLIASVSMALAAASALNWPTGDEP